MKYVQVEAEVKSKTELHPHHLHLVKISINKKMVNYIQQKSNEGLMPKDHQ